MSFQKHCNPCDNIQNINNNNLCHDNTKYLLNDINRKIGNKYPSDCVDISFNHLGSTLFEAEATNNAILQAQSFILSNPLRNDLLNNLIFAVPVIVSCYIQNCSNVPKSVLTFTLFQSIANLQYVVLKFAPYKSGYQVIASGALPDANVSQVIDIIPQVNENETIVLGLQLPTAIPLYNYVIATLGGCPMECSDMLSLFLKNKENEEQDENCANNLFDNILKKLAQKLKE